MEFFNIKLYLHTNEDMIGLISAIGVFMIILVLMGLNALLVECALAFMDLFKIIFKHKRKSGNSRYGSDLEMVNMAEDSEPLLQPTDRSFDYFNPRQAHAAYMRTP